jgi:uncharacterized membrane protein
MSHGHSHSLPDRPVSATASRRLRRLFAIVLLPLVIVTAVLTVVLLPDHEVTVDALRSQTARGLVTAIIPCPDRGGECDRATVTVEAGTGEGQVVTARASRGPQQNTITVGDRVLMQVNPLAEPLERYVVIDRDRTRTLVILGIVFALAVVLLSRWRGLAAIAALVVTGAVITLFVLPALAGGADPLLVAVAGSGLVMIIALPLTHGFGPQTWVALTGTLGALALTGVLGAAALRMAEVTGYASAGAAEVDTHVPGINVSGILLAGLVLGALGVLDDVTVTQAATVWELAAADTSSSARTLYTAGMRVGRSHVASVVNTLFLAYAGGALPLLMLYAISGADVVDVLTREGVAVEVVRALVGSLGIIAAVPLTTGLAAVTLGRLHANVTEPQAN